MLIWSAPSGDAAHKYSDSVVLTFAGPRCVMSTSPFNGGLRRDLRNVFNHCCMPHEGMYCAMLAPTYGEHLSIIARRLGLDPSVSAGLSTAAGMDNMSIVTERFGGAEVTALVTAGAEANAVRAGDPAEWDEERESEKHTDGTINIILHIGCGLSDGGMARALMTVTEAKTAALQELSVPSRYSCGIATGTGTDGVIVISNPSSPPMLTDIGGHSKLGEITARAVKSAVKDALRRQSGLTAERQRGALRRCGRFGLTEDALWERFACRASCGRPEFSDALHELSSNPDTAAVTALFARLMDEVSWGLLRPGDVGGAASALLRTAGFEADIPDMPGGADAAVDALKDMLADVLLKGAERLLRR